MRHQKAGRKFGRKSAPRTAMFENMVSSLIEHERIRTTDAKAKELRRIAEPVISWATSVGNLISEKKQDAEDKARIVHAVRQARRVVKQRPTLEKLFQEIGPRLAGRPGGFLRILKLGNRPGDAAPMSLVELVDYQPPGVKDADAPAAEAKSEDAPKAAKGSKKAKAASDDAPAAEAKPKAKKPKAKKSDE